MAWPAKLNYVLCSGFDTKYLPLLKQAIETESIEWYGKPSVFAGSASGTFKWAGCNWEMEEHFETIHRLTMLEGILTEESLTFATLQLKEKEENNDT